MADVLVVTSRIKAEVKKMELRTSADFIEGLSKIVENAIGPAVLRAKAAGRKTVQAVDLIDPSKQ